MRRELLAISGSLILVSSLLPPIQGAQIVDRMLYGANTRLAHRTDPEIVGNQNADESGAIEILEKYVAAIGGRDAFHSTKTFEIQTELQVLGRTIKRYSIDDRTNKRRYERQEGGNGVNESGFDGKQ